MLVGRSAVSRMRKSIPRGSKKSLRPSRGLWSHPRGPLVTVSGNLQIMQCSRERSSKIWAADWHLSRFVRLPQSFSQNQCFLSAPRHNVVTHGMSSCDSAVFSLRVVLCREAARGHPCWPQSDPRNLECVINVHFMCFVLWPTKPCCTITLHV